MASPWSVYVSFSLGPSYSAMSSKTNHPSLQLLQYSVHHMQCGSKILTIYSGNIAGIDVLQSKV